MAYNSKFKNILRIPFSIDSINFILRLYGPALSVILGQPLYWLTATNVKFH